MLILLLFENFSSRIEGIVPGTVLINIIVACCYTYMLIIIICQTYLNIKISFMTHTLKS